MRTSTSSSPPSSAARSTRTATSPTSTPGWPGPRPCRPGRRASYRPWSSTRWSPVKPASCPVNIPNAGQVPDVPGRPVVESICVVDGDGIRGRDVAPLPPPYAELVRRHVAVSELTVAAALDGDRTAGRGRLPPRSAGRPGRPPPDRAMVDELLSGTAAWLPQFEPADRYRPRRPVDPVDHAPRRAGGGHGLTSRSSAVTAITPMPGHH